MAAAAIAGNSARPAGVRWRRAVVLGALLVAAAGYALAGAGGLGARLRGVFRPSRGHSAGDGARRRASHGQDSCGHGASRDPSGHGDASAVRSPRSGRAGAGVVAPARRRPSSARRLCAARRRLPGRARYGIGALIARAVPARTPPGAGVRPSARWPLVRGRRRRPRRRRRPPSRSRRRSPPAPAGPAAEFGFER